MGFLNGIRNRLGPRSTGNSALAEMSTRFMLLHGRRGGPAVRYWVYAGPFRDGTESAVAMYAAQLVIYEAEFREDPELAARALLACESHRELFAEDSRSFEQMRLNILNVADPLSENEKERFVAWLDTSIAIFEKIENGE